MGVVRGRKPLLLLRGTALVLCRLRLRRGRQEGSSTRPHAGRSNKLVALVSDIGKFNDRSFNQSQKEGLDRAQSDLGVKTLAAPVELASDYVPNLTTRCARRPT